MTTLTATDILAIAPEAPISLFPGETADVKARFRVLAKEWHPDHNPDPRAGDVLRHLTLLRSVALGKAVKPAAAKAPTERTFTTAQGKAWRLRFLTSRPTEEGEVFVGRHIVAYLIRPDLADLAAAAVNHRFHFADRGMEEEMARFLPIRETAVETTEGTIFVYKRTDDQVLLRDLLAHQGGQVAPVHAAWLTSALENIACYLGWSKLVHGAIGPDSLLVSPKFHSVALTGPVLYATPVGQRPKALPGRTMHLLPRLGLPGVPADAALDPELIRLTVREALGDPAGTALLHRADLPREVALWLVTPPADDAFRDYGTWEAARSAFGQRRFAEFKVSPEDVYPTT